MTRELRFGLVLALLVGGTMLAVVGHNESRVNMSSILALWSDEARDVDQIGMRLTRMNDADEMAVGNELAPLVYGGREESGADAAYLGDVAELLVPHVRRRGIQYRFHLIDSAAINAFAMPGGHVFVTTGLMGFLESEAELASVLGHEIAHVDLRHCVERYQYQYKLKKAGMSGAGLIVEVAHRLATMGFSPYQESEADLDGAQMAIRAGYDPDAAARLFQRMHARFGEPATPAAKTPDEEVGQVVGDAIGSYFRSHPPSADRARQLRELVARHGVEFQGRSFYVGVRNFNERVSRPRAEYAEEFVVFGRR